MLLIKKLEQGLTLLKQIPKLNGKKEHLSLKLLKHGQKSKPTCGLMMTN
jgi:hypothetical protein